MPFVAPLAQAAPQTGFYWNAAEPGRGFFVEKVGGSFFFAGLYFAADGRPTWVVSNAPMPDPNVYDGRLESLFGGQMLGGLYQAPAEVNDAGPVHIVFGDDTHASLTWPGGDVALVRQDVEGGAASGIVPESGVWWNADEAGGAFVIDANGGHVVVGALMFEPSGDPVWYVADGVMSDGSRFKADLLRTATGQTMGGDYVAPSTPVVAGSIALHFSAPDRAKVTLTDAAGNATTSHLKPLQVKPPLLARPKSLPGSFSQAIDTADGERTLLVDGTITLLRTDDASDGSAHYVAQAGGANLRLVGIVSQDEGSCLVDASGSVTLGGDAASIDVQADGVYSGAIGFDSSLDVVACAALFSAPISVRIGLAGRLEGQDAVGPQPGMAVPGAWNRWTLSGREQ
jgi:hypothetical protein